MVKKKPLTPEEHKAVGAMLRRMNRQFVTLSVKVHNAYPANIRGGKISTNLHRIQGALSTLRSELEEVYAKEDPTWTTKVYYGGDDSKLLEFIPADKLNLLHSAIQQEYERGTEKWGTGPHTVAEYLVLLDREIEKAKTGWATTKGDYVALNGLLQLLTLTLRCFNENTDANSLLYK